MKLKFFDSRILGNKSNRGRKPSAYGLETTITVAPLSGRIYLSTGLVKKFMLDVHRFGLAMDESSGSVFFYLDDEHGFRPQQHQHSYFIHSKTTVQEILTEVSEDERTSVLFEVSDATIIVNDKTLFKLVPDKSESSKRGPALFNDGNL